MIAGAARGFFLVLAVGCTLVGAARAAPLAPAFVTTPCDLPSISRGIRSRLDCGFVVVPHAYDDLSAPGFRLAIVVVKTAAQPALTDPVVYVSGGPGGPTLLRPGTGRRPSLAREPDGLSFDCLFRGRLSVLIGRRRHLASASPGEVHADLDDATPHRLRRGTQELVVPEGCHGAQGASGGRGQLSMEIHGLVDQVANRRALGTGQILKAGIVLMFVQGITVSSRRLSRINVQAAS